MVTKMMFRRLSIQALPQGNTATVILKVSNLYYCSYIYRNANAKPNRPPPSLPPSLYYPHILLLPWNLSENQ